MKPDQCWIFCCLTHDKASAEHAISLTAKKERKKERKKETQKQTKKKKKTDLIKLTG